MSADSTPSVKYVVEFDYRSDDGPRLVGPFDSKDEASAYVASLNLRVAEWVVAPLAVTEHRVAVVTDTPPVKPTPADAMWDAVRLREDNPQASLDQHLASDSTFHREGRWCPICADLAERLS